MDEDGMLLDSYNKSSGAIRLHSATLRGARQRHSHGVGRTPLRLDTFLITWLCLAAFFSYPFLVHAETPIESGPIGQTNCYDALGFMLFCPTTPDETANGVQSDIFSRFTDIGEDTVIDGLTGLALRKDQNGDIRAFIVQSDPRFHDNEDGTVTDIDTGLIWLRDANCIASSYPGFDKEETDDDGRVSWKRAGVFIRRINEGRYRDCGAGQTDWKLPSLEELLSLIGGSGDQVKVWLLGHGFVNVDPIFYWTTAENLWNIYFAMGVSLQNGTVANLPKSLGLNVLPVRTARGKK